MKNEPETPQIGAKITYDSLSANIRQLVLANNLMGLKPEERVLFHDCICAQKGLDPSTRPFEFILLSGKLIMYARKECADQLRQIHGISARIISAEMKGPVYIAHIRATTKEGREEDDIGATSVEEPEYLEKKDNIRQLNPRFGKAMEGATLANALMKAVTKGKRRATLAISGLGMYDESEVEAIKDADKGRAPTLDEVKEVAAKVAALREKAAKLPKADKVEKDALIRMAVELEASIMDYDGSGHTPEKPAEQAKVPEEKKPEPAKPETPPVIQGQPEKAKEEPAKPKEEPAKAPPVQEQQQKPADAQKSFEELIAEIDTSKWQEYIFQDIPNPAFKGKAVKDLPIDRLVAAKTAWIGKFKTEIARNPKRLMDAAFMIAACAAQGK